MAPRIARLTGMVGSVNRTLDVAQQGVHPAQPWCLAAARAASGNLRLVCAASNLPAPETSQPIRAHRCLSSSGSGSPARGRPWCPHVLCLLPQLLKMWQWCGSRSTSAVAIAVSPLRKRVPKLPRTPRRNRWLPCRTFEDVSHIANSRKAQSSVATDNSIRNLNCPTVAAAVPSGIEVPPHPIKRGPPCIDLTARRKQYAAG